MGAHPLRPELLEHLQAHATAGLPLPAPLVRELWAALAPRRGGRHASRRKRLEDALVDLVRAEAIVRARAGGPRRGGLAWLEAQFEAADRLAGTQYAGSDKAMEASRFRAARHLANGDLCGDLTDELGGARVSALAQGLEIEHGVCEAILGGAVERSAR